MALDSTADKPISMSPCFENKVNFFGTVKLCISKYDKQTLLKWTPAVLKLKKIFF